MTKRNTSASQAAPKIQGQLRPIGVGSGSEPRGIARVSLSHLCIQSTPDVPPNVDAAAERTIRYQPAGLRAPATPRRCLWMTG
jgi:hypothetical protein